MLKQIASLVEELQRVILDRGGKLDGLSIEIHCESIPEWSILDQTVEKELLRDQPHLILERCHTKMIVPSMLSWNGTPVRITYGRKD